MVAHLQQQTSSIVAASKGGAASVSTPHHHLPIQFYNNNNDLEDLAAPWSFLFGVLGSGTDTMNHLEGPTLGQVFADSGAWNEVYANLTNGSVLRARLTNVAVRENTYLGVPAYTLDSLVILSNQYSDTFINSFADAEIKSNLDPHFPNTFDVALPTLDANVLCMMQDWKVGQYKGEIGAALGLA